LEANKIKLGTVILSIAAVAIIELTVHALISRGFVAKFTGLGIARVADIIVLLTIIKFSDRRISAIGLSSTHAVKGLKKGLIWAISFGATAAGVLLVIHLFGTDPRRLFQMRLPSEASRLIPFLLAGALVGPIAEEIFFRGILYRFLRRWGIPTAVILSTLVFALPHSSAQTIPVTQIIGGILFAVSYEVEKNLLVPITIHCLGNLAIFTLACAI
jgi:membrane protease YdiL (CAAX protease family)